MLAKPTIFQSWIEKIGKERDQYVNDGTREYILIVSKVISSYYFSVWTGLTTLLELEFVPYKFIRFCYYQNTLSLVFYWDLGI